MGEGEWISSEPPLPHAAVEKSVAPEPTIVRTSRPWDIVVVLLFVLLHAIVQSFLGIYYTSVYSSPADSFFSLVQTSVHQIPIVALILYLISRSGRRFSEFGLRRRIRALDWALASCILCAYWILSPILTHAMDMIFGTPPSINFARPRTIYEFPLAVSEMFIIGVSEELVWRGYLQTRFRQEFQSPGQAVIVTAILFGFAHLYQGMSGVIVATFFGLLTGLCFEWRRQIVPLAIMHALLNFLLIIVYSS